jgi:hypothetical protein
VAVKTVAGTPGDRRVHGLLESADDEGFVVRVDEPSASDDGSEPPTTRRLSYDEVEQARTVFEWGPPAKPAGANRRTKRSKGAAARRPAAEQKQQKKVIAS